MRSCKIQPQVTQSKSYDQLPHLADPEIGCLSLAIPGEYEPDSIGYNEHFKANHIKAILLMSSMISYDYI